MSNMLLGMDVGHELDFKEMISAAVFDHDWSDPYPDEDYRLDEEVCNEIGQIVLDILEGEWLDWPEQPGYYWFYGWPGARRYGVPMLVMAKAHYDAGRKLVVHFFVEFLHRGHIVGKFLPAYVPFRLPDLGEGE